MSEEPRHWSPDVVEHICSARSFAVIARTKARELHEDLAKEHRRSMELNPSSPHAAARQTAASQLQSIIDELGRLEWPDVESAHPPHCIVIPEVDLAEVLNDKPAPERWSPEEMQYRRLAGVMGCLREAERLLTWTQNDSGLPLRNLTHLGPAANCSLFLNSERFHSNAF